MNQFLLVFIVVTTIVTVIAAVYILRTYNLFMTLTNNIQEAWSNTTSSLKKRHDIMTKLTKITKGYAELEKKVQIAATGVTVQDFNASEKKFAGIVTLIEEAQPELRSNENFRKLCDELVAIENDIQAHRLIYNRAIALYRNALRKIPQNLVAYGFGFVQVDFFEFDTAL